MCVCVSYWWAGWLFVAKPVSECVCVTGWMLTCVVKVLWVVQKLEKHHIYAIHSVTIFCSCMYYCRVCSTDCEWLHFVTDICLSKEVLGWWYFGESWGQAASTKVNLKLRWIVTVRMWTMALCWGWTAPYNVYNKVWRVAWQQNRHNETAQWRCSLCQHQAFVPIWLSFSGHLTWAKWRPSCTITPSCCCQVFPLIHWKV